MKLGWKAAIKGPAIETLSCTWLESLNNVICTYHNNGWASLVSQMVKNLPAVRETWVWSLGWEDPLEEGMATHSNILA